MTEKSSLQGPRPLLSLINLTAGYAHPKRPPLKVVDDLSAVLHRGELVCLIGPNGAGKSTLMRTLAGMQRPISGRVLFGDEDVHQMRVSELAKRLSVVLTERLTVSMMSSYALVALGRYPHTDWTGQLTNKDHEVIRWAMNAVGAEEFAARNVVELSDGERQKIMLARALAQEAQVLVLDEITAFLDLPRRVEIMRILRQLAKAANHAILLSTHDLDLALRTADRVWLLPKGGSFHSGTPEELVLSGAFETAFKSEGVDFDPLLGSFRLHRNFIGEINLDGEGVHAVWTARAFERQGFRVIRAERATAGKGPRVEVLVDGSLVRWKSITDGTEREYQTLSDLVRALTGDATR
jgi:iron complex transport system ATP-binding protein